MCADLATSVADAPGATRTYAARVYKDADVEANADRLGSPDADVRALAAGVATDGVSHWGHHSYTASQAARISAALVDALARETNATARESILNAIATLVAWDLAPIAEVRRAVGIPRPQDDALAHYWRDIEDGAERRG